MNAKKCDRCGVFYEEVEPDVFDRMAQALTKLAKSVSQIKAEDRLNEVADFCPYCQKSFAKWFKKYKIEYLKTAESEGDV